MEEDLCALVAALGDGSVPLNRDAVRHVLAEMARRIVALQQNVDLLIEQTPRSLHEPDDELPPF